jgi:hypothetical protein
LSPDEIKQLIARKNRKRPIDCRVILSDFKSFISNLQKESSEKASILPRRVQAVCCLQESDQEDAPNQHWSALDILITSDKMQVFYLDGAGDSKNYKHIVPILSSMPNVELTCCEEKLQHDTESCSIFALDHVFHMSKIPNLHAIIDAGKKADTENSLPNVCVFNPINLPPSLVRNAQSLRFITNYKAAHPEEAKEVLNKKGQTLMDYVLAHSMFYRPKNTTVNLGIQYKQIVYKNRLRSV